MMVGGYKDGRLRGEGTGYTYIQKFRFAYYSLLFRYFRSKIFPF